MNKRINLSNAMEIQMKAIDKESDSKAIVTRLRLTILMNASIFF